ncbi:MAG: hypothetical protein WCC98_16710 [Candidatus Acidiferrales bacterium]
MSEISDAKAQLYTAQQKVDQVNSILRQEQDRTVAAKVGLKIVSDERQFVEGEVVAAQAKLANVRSREKDASSVLAQQVSREANANGAVASANDALANASTALLRLS